MRVTPLARRLGTAALVLTLGAGVSSCSDESSDSSAAEPSAEPSVEPSAEPSAGVSDEATAEPRASLVELSADDFYPSVMAAMREAETFTFESVSGVAGESQTMSGHARFGDDGVEMKASSTGARAMELILLDGVMYLRSPDLGTGDTWARIDLDDPSSLVGMIGRAMDPEVMFTALESPTALELVGPEDIDGVATHHYRIAMDPSQYLAAMGFPAAMAEMLPKELMTDLWIDADNLPRKFAQTIDLPAAGGGAGTSSTTQGRYADFGTDVEIEAPPADEVTEGLPGA